MTDTYTEYLTTARQAATDAAAELDARFRDSTSVRTKEDGTVVTDADLASERTILSTISSRHPGHAVFSEESGREGASRYTWIVDPLDGTANFVNGYPHYCVSIALVIDGSPIVGVVARPETGDVYTAVKGCGAKRNGNRLTVSSTEALASSSILFGVSPPIANDDGFVALHRALIDPERTASVRRFGAGACDLSLVAGGRFDCFLDKYTSPWDVAAGILLVSEAGGRVTTWEGEPVDLSENERSVHLVASNGGIHEKLRRLYRDVSE